MPSRSTISKVSLGMAAVQAGDAIACGAGAAPIKAALDAVDCPEEVRSVLPAIKLASAVGLAAGAKNPKLGAATCVALIAYFLAAIGFHIKAKDAKGAPPAIAMLAIFSWLGRQHANLACARSADIATIATEAS